MFCLFLNGESYWGDQCVITTIYTHLSRVQIHYFQSSNARPFWIKFLALLEIFDLVHALCVNEPTAYGQKYMSGCFVYNCIGTVLFFLLRHMQMSEYGCTLEYVCAVWKVWKMCIPAFISIHTDFKYVLLHSNYEWHFGFSGIASLILYCMDVIGPTLPLTGMNYGSFQPL